MAGVNRLKSEIAALQRELSKMTVGSSANNTTTNNNQAPAANRRTRARRARRAANAISAPRGRGRGGRGGGPGRAVVAPRIQNTRMRDAPALADGTIRIRRREYAFDVTGTPQGQSAPDYYRALNPEQWPWLKGLSKSFDRWICHSIRLEYKPAVGTNTAGRVAFGIDWDSNKETQPNWKNYVMTLTPLIETPVWQGTAFNLPPSRLMSRRSYALRKKSTDSTPDDFDLNPGWLCWWASGKTTDVYGDLWICYDVTLFGTGPN